MSFLLCKSYCGSYVSMSLKTLVRIFAFIVRLFDVQRYESSRSSNTAVPKLF